MYDLRAASAAQTGSLARENAVLPASSAVTFPSKIALPMHPKVPSSACYLPQSGQLVLGG